MVEKRECKQCSKELTKRQKYYCCKSCKAKAEGTKHMEGKRKSRIIKTCEWCGELVKERNTRRFCSRDCYKLWWSNKMKNNQHSLGAVRTEEFKQNLSEKMKGENNPMFGVTGEQHPSWTEDKKGRSYIPKPTRKAIYERTSSCALCGESEGIGSGDRGLDIHHIEPYDISNDNSLDNLLLVCRQCHSDIHRQYNKESVYKDISDEQILELKDRLRKLAKEINYD